MGTIQVEFNTRPIDVNVILNGGALLTEFKKEFLEDLMATVSSEVSWQLGNLDGGMGLPRS